MLITINREISYTAHKIASKFPIKGFHRIALILSQLIIPQAKPGLNLIRTIHNQLIYVDPLENKGIDNSLYYSGTYEPAVVELLRSSLNKSDTFISIGGNIGSMEIVAAQSVSPTGKIYSFEPDPDLVKIITKNAEINNLKNITVIPKGLGSKQSVGKLYLNTSINRGASSLHKSVGESYKKIQIERFDTMIHELGIKDIRLILIDVEGWELEVLKGAKKYFGDGNRPILCIECVEKYKPEKIYHFLKNYKEYTIYKFKNGKANYSKLTKINSVKEIPKDDNIVCLTKTHLKSINTFKYLRL